jgi:branched-chain amino acid transport system substrate-binding protein
LQLKPVFLDVFRPQLDNQIGLIGRLQKAGATNVFVGGDRDDVAIMAATTPKLGAGIGFAGGEACARRRRMECFWLRARS